MPVALPVIGVGALVALLVGFALVLLMQAYARPILEAIAHPNLGLLARILLFPFSELAKALIWIERKAVSVLSRAVNALAAPVVHWLGGLAVLVEDLAGYLGSLPGEIESAILTLVHDTIPAIAEDIVYWVRGLAHHAVTLAEGVASDLTTTADNLVRALERDGLAAAADFVGAMGWLGTHFDQLWWEAYHAIFPKVNALYDQIVPGIEAGVRDLTQTVQGIEAGVRDVWDYILGTLAAGIDALGVELGQIQAFIDGVLVPDIAALGRRLDDLYNEVWNDLKTRLDALLNGVIPAAMLAGIVAALTLLWDGIFCRNTNAAGKQLCGLEAALLDDALAGLFLVASIADFRSLVELMQGAVHESTTIISDLLQV